MIKEPKNIQEVIEEIEKEMDELSTKIHYLNQTYTKIYKYKLYLENILKGDKDGSKKNS